SARESFPASLFANSRARLALPAASARPSRPSPFLSRSLNPGASAAWTAPASAREAAIPVSLNFMRSPFRAESSQVPRLERRLRGPARDPASREPRERRQRDDGRADEPPRRLVGIFEERGDLVSEHRGGEHAGQHAEEGAEPVFPRL